MKIKSPHSWDIAPKKAIHIQRTLTKKIKLNWDDSPPKLIAGAGISFSKNTTMDYAGVVILSFPSID